MNSGSPSIDSVCELLAAAPDASARETLGNVGLSTLYFGLMGRWGADCVGYVPADASGAEVLEMVEPFRLNRVEFDGNVGRVRLSPVDESAFPALYRASLDPNLGTGGGSGARHRILVRLCRHSLLERRRSFSSQALTATCTGSWRRTPTKQISATATSPSCGALNDDQTARCTRECSCSSNTSSRLPRTGSSTQRSPSTTTRSWAYLASDPSRRRDASSSTTSTTTGGGTAYCSPSTETRGILGRSDQIAHVGSAILGER